MENTKYNEHVTQCDRLQREFGMIEAHLRTTKDPVPASITSVQADLTKYQQQWAKSNQSQIVAAFDSGNYEPTNLGNTTNYNEHVTLCDNLQTEFKMIEGHLQAQKETVPGPIRSLQTDLDRYQQWRQSNQSQIEAAFTAGGGKGAGAGAGAHSQG